ncbi:hypothetical protein PQX77_018966 [Marasmius sp. AFHP31]|nr:hypothetical protein PQX77_018966 [Marasmius sp. AFHP31]
MTTTGHVEDDLETNANPRTVEGVAIFLSRAASRFQNASDAINHLRKLGYPPRDVDMAHPSTRIDTVLTIFAALTVHQKHHPRLTSIHVRSNWSAVLARWIDYFIEHVILTQESLTPEGMDTVEYSIICILGLLQLPEESMDFVRHESPHLQKLLAQVFFRLIDQSHDSWGPWAHLLMRINPSQECSFHYSKHPRATRAVYQDEQQLGSVLIQHLHQQALRIPKMGVQGLEYLGSYINILLIPENFQNDNPMFLTNPKGSISAFIDVLCRVLRKKSLRAATADNEEFKCAWGVASLAFETIYLLTDDREHVEMVHWRRLIKAIFDADAPFLYSRPSKGLKGFAEWSTLIIDRMARFLVYKSIANQFHQILRKGVVTKEALEKIGAGAIPHGKNLMVAWVNVVEKAEISRAHHRTMKLKVLCNYPECPLYEASAEERAQVRYLRCLGCFSSAMYCSRQCRKLDWKIFHCVQCLKTRNTPVRIDAYFNRSFEEWLKSYVRTHADILIERQKQFLKFIHLEANLHPEQTPEDRKLILGSRKQPALFIDFNKASLPDPNDPIRVQFVDHTLLETGVLPHNPDPDPEPACQSTLKHWDDPTVDETKLFVFGLFPNNRIRPFRMFDVMEFPPGVGNMEYEGFYKRIQHDSVKGRDIKEVLEGARARYGERARASLSGGL